jgi:hypothetical protein
MQSTRINQWQNGQRSPDLCNTTEWHLICGAPLVGGGKDGDYIARNIWDKNLDLIFFNINLLQH